MPPLHLAGFRFTLAGLVILPFCRNMGANLKAIWPYRAYVLKLAFYSTFLIYSLFHIGINMVPASVTALVVGSGPLFIALFARWFKNEPLTKRKSMAIVTGLSGIGIIAAGRFGGFLSVELSWLGLGILILSNLSGSFGNILISNNKVPVNPVFINAVQLIVGGIGILLLALLLEEYHYTPLPLVFYLSMAWLVLIATIGFSLWFIVLTMPGVKVSEITVWKFIIPVMGAILSWLILPDEKPEWVVVAGIILVGLSLVVMYYRPLKK